MKRKTFYSWSIYTPEDWIKDHKEEITVLGQTTRDYKPHQNYKIKAKETIVFYEEKK